MQAAMLRAPGDAVVVARELVKRFGGFTAVDGLGFSVRRGECFGLLGPNGAGKSTTLKLLLGLLAPDAGSVELVGEPVPRRALEARRRVGDNAPMALIELMDRPEPAEGGESASAAG